MHELTVRRSGTPVLDRPEPLWKRVPTRGANGQTLADFMMIIPGLRSRTRLELRETIDEIQRVFHAYAHAVEFADLNLRLNLLWVSVKPLPGITLELATAINARVPDARLVAHKFE